VLDAFTHMFDFSGAATLLHLSLVSSLQRNIPASARTGRCACRALAPASLDCAWRHGPTGQRAVLGGSVCHGSSTCGRDRRSRRSTR
jgi:hypothetical protein